MDLNKKVVFFSVFPPFRGGISKFSNLLASALSKRVNLVSINFKKQYPKILFPGKSQYDESKPYGELIRVGSPFNLFSFRKLSKRIDEQKPDIFIASYWMTFMAPLLMYVSKRRSKHCVRILLVHNFKPHESRFFDKYMNRSIVKHFDKFIVLSNSVKQEILRLEPNKSVKVIPHPVYDDYLSKISQNQARKKLGLGEDKLTLLFFGLIRPYKGLDILLKAFSELSEKYQLLIAGEVYGKSKDYEEIMDRSKNKNIVFINKYIPEDQVNIYFSSADLCILPYRSGTQSGVKSIADYFEVPCLMSKVGGLCEGIVHEQNGFVLDELNEIALRKNIEEIFEKNLFSKIKFKEMASKTNVNDQWILFVENLLDYSNQ